MNQRIRELAEQAEDYAYSAVIGGEECQEAYTKKFAELVVSDAVNVLREEWYQLNNSEYNHDDPRSVGLHHGMKTGINKSMVLIRKHFGVEK